MDWLVKISVLLASWVVIAVGGILVVGEYQRVRPAKPVVAADRPDPELAEIFRMAGAGPGELAKVIEYCAWNRDRAVKGEPVAQIVAACDRQALR